VLGHGILSGNAIREAVAEGTIRITPFRTDQINPASYDLRLGKGVRVYTEPLPGREIVLDAKTDNPSRYFEMGAEGMILKPGTGYLLHTEEVVGTSSLVPVLDGKSSLGRLFLNVHFTAGYGDAGFLGQYTMEVSVLYPLRVYPGMRFAQIRFHTIAGEQMLYQGNYQGAAALGPVASRSWKQFGP